MSPNKEKIYAALSLVERGDISIDDEGRIWRHHYYGQHLGSPRRLDTTISNGYRSFAVDVGGRRLILYAHRLVWEAKRGPIPDGSEINHKDFDRKNNNLNNLELVSRTENARHAANGGRYKNRHPSPPRPKVNTVAKVSPCAHCSISPVTQNGALYCSPRCRVRACRGRSKGATITATLLPGRKDALIRLAQERQQTRAVLLADAAWIGLQVMEGKKPTIPTRESDLDRIAAIKGLAGYDRAVRRFVAQNLPLAYSYAERWRCKEIPQEDLKQQAVIGLVEAVQRWDPSKGATWSNYALTRMRFTVQRYVAKKEPLVHLPQNVLDDRRITERTQRQLRQSLDRDPTPEEIAAKTGLTIERVRVALTARAEIVYEAEK